LVFEIRYKNLLINSESNIDCNQIKIMRNILPFQLVLIILHMQAYMLYIRTKQRIQMSSSFRARRFITVFTFGADLSNFGLIQTISYIV
jgi:hypothetical protein